MNRIGFIGTIIWLTVVSLLIFGAIIYFNSDTDRESQEHQLAPEHEETLGNETIHFFENTSLENTSNWSGRGQSLSYQAHTH